MNLAQQDLKELFDKLSKTQGLNPDKDYKAFVAQIQINKGEWIEPTRDQIIVSFNSVVGKTAEQQCSNFLYKATEEERISYNLHWKPVNGKTIIISESEIQINKIEFRSQNVLIDQVEHSKNKTEKNDQQEEKISKIIIDNHNDSLLKDEECLPTKKIHDIARDLGIKGWTEKNSKEGICYKKGVSTNGWQVINILGNGSAQAKNVIKEKFMQSCIAYKYLVRNIKPSSASFNIPAGLVMPQIKAIKAAREVSVLNTIANSLGLKSYSIRDPLKLAYGVSMKNSEGWITLSITGKGEVETKKSLSDKIRSGLDEKGFETRKLMPEKPGFSYRVKPTKQTPESNIITPENDPTNTSLVLSQLFNNPNLHEVLVNLKLLMGITTEYKNQMNDFKTEIQNEFLSKILLHGSFVLNTNPHYDILEKLGMIASDEQIDKVVKSL